LPLRLVERAWWNGVETTPSAGGARSVGKAGGEREVYIVERVCMGSGG
jgi:hypothetical protein